MRCPAHIRIGTRASNLAVAQANEVKNRLLGAFPELTQNQIEIIKIITTGDKIQNRHLADIGGKGLFTKELEEALFAGELDMAVHSLKDIPDYLPDGLQIECVLEREDPRDALISNKYKSIEEIAEGATIGTSALRRQSQLLKYRPDLKIIPIRGNVNTRLRKLDEGEVDATMLAVAGLKRLDLTNRISQAIPTDVMLPAVSQGAIGVEASIDNEHIQNMLKAINHPQSYTEVKCERAFLKTLNGSCQTPIGGYAVTDNTGMVNFKGLVTSPDGKEFHEVEYNCTAQDARETGFRAGEEMLKKASHLLNN